MGERTPHLDPDARAALVGLAADHTRAHVVRAILEGVAFSLKDTLTIFKELGIPVKAIRVGGGGARSPLWRQIQADVYGQTVETVQAEEGAAYGAALLAGVGAGVWSSVDAACDAVVRVAKRTAADPGAVTRHARRATPNTAAFTLLYGVSSQPAYGFCQTRADFSLVPSVLRHGLAQAADLPSKDPVTLLGTRQPWLKWRATP